MADKEAAINDAANSIIESHDKSINIMLKDNESTEWRSLSPALEEKKGSSDTLNEISELGDAIYTETGRLVEIDFDINDDDNLSENESETLNGNSSFSAKILENMSYIKEKKDIQTEAEKVEEKKDIQTEAEKVEEKKDIQTEAEKVEEKKDIQTEAEKVEEKKDIQTEAEKKVSKGIQDSKLMKRISVDKTKEKIKAGSTQNAKEIASKFEKEIIPSRLNQRRPSLEELERKRAATVSKESVLEAEKRDSQAPGRKEVLIEKLENDSKHQDEEWGAQLKKSLEDGKKATRRVSALDKSKIINMEALLRKQSSVDEGVLLPVGRLDKSRIDSVSKIFQEEEAPPKDSNVDMEGVGKLGDRLSALSAAMEKTPKLKEIDDHTQNRIASIIAGDLSLLPSTSELKENQKEGYLKKRGTGRLNSTFRKRFFIMKDGMLYWMKKPEDSKPLGMLSFCERGLEVRIMNDTTIEISTAKKVYILQSETKEEMESWMTVFKQARLYYVGTIAWTEKNYEAMTQEEKEQEKTLDRIRAGASFMKYKYKKGQPRYVWVTSDLQKLCWGTLDKNMRNSLYTKDIIEVKNGCPDAKYQPCGLQVITSERSLDLEAANKVQAEDWIQSIQLLQRILKEIEEGSNHPEERIPIPLPLSP